MRISLLVGCILFLYSWSQSAFSVSYSETLSQPCNGCHGPDGVSAGKSIPSIAGLDIRYFMRTMLRFKRNERVATIMDRIAQGYEVTELKKISTYFSELEWRNASIRNIDEKERQKGRDIHDELCVECHEDNGRHQDKEIPRISGQSINYLYLQMMDYRDGKENMPQPEKMKERMGSLTNEDLRAVSVFYASGE